MKTLISTLWMLVLVSAQSGYTGLWYRDDVRSDDPEAKIERAARGFIEKTSRGRRSADDVDPQAMKQLRHVIDTFVQHADELYVDDNGKDFVIDDGSEKLRIFYLDAKKHERQMADGTRLETTATRTGSQIDVFQKTNQGAKIYETYTLANDGDEMVLSVRLEDKQLKAPLVIRNVYSRAE